MKPKHIPLIVNVILILVFAAGIRKAHATVTPISSSIELRARADAGLGTFGETSAASQISVLNPLSVSVFAEAFNGNLRESAESSANASWTSPESGQFSLRTRYFSDYGGTLAYSSMAAGGLAWVYSFSSDLPATLTLSYQITRTDAYAPLDVTMGILADELIYGPQLQVPSSGSLSFPIHADEVYTFVLYDGSNWNGVFGTFDGEMDSAFSFQITAVPEPGAIALLGFGLAAWFIRGRDEA